MNIKDEMIYDFGLNMPRILVSGKTAIIDNIKKIVLISQTSIIVDNGNRYTAVNGDNLVVNQLGEERMQITGNINMVEFYERK
ncbi:YabP/YqfC family sporulation protein [Anaerovorax odorimutans]|uniref:YabP/YqfC family sporulation protein n=1 Tax=Anaerovorax odorimutans TaxID=109327 RepID=UPI000402B258|nr:YabP/YqfC family sporulation protein [Anaerovorax odorimutans]